MSPDVKPCAEPYATEIINHIRRASPILKTRLVSITATPFLSEMIRSDQKKKGTSGQHSCQSGTPEGALQLRVFRCDVKRCSTPARCTAGWRPKNPANFPRSDVAGTVSSL